MTPARLLEPALRRDPARPLLTQYDDATGERVELSAATAANWVAKTANLLVDGLAVEPGARVSVLLPAHWQTATVLLGAWTAGCSATLGPDPAADVVLAAADRLDEALALDAPDTLGLSLAPLAAPLTDLPPGVLDFASQVRVHGDQARAVPVAPDALALTVAGRELTGAGLVAVTQERVAALALRADDRVLTAGDWDTLDGLLDGLLAPLAVGASIVLCRHPDADRLATRASAERVTVTQGVAVAGVRPLSGT